jgi:hypothetical protein
MVPIEQRIKFAEDLARPIAQSHLLGPRDARNEWMRWAQVVKRYGLRRALHHAQQLADDPGMRENIRKANSLIARTVRQHLAELERLNEQDLRSVLGFVAWHLRIMRRSGQEQRREFRRR